MSTKQFRITLKQNQKGDVAEWFSSMNRESIPASIEYRDDDAKKVEVVGITNNTKNLVESDEELILHTMFERYKMAETDTSGAFCEKSSVGDLENFKSHFTVEEVPK